MEAWKEVPKSKLLSTIVLISDIAFFQLLVLLPNKVHIIVAENDGKIKEVLKVNCFSRIYANFVKIPFFLVTSFNNLLRMSCIIYVAAGSEVS